MRTIEINKMLALTIRLKNGYNMDEKDIITKDLIDLFMDSKYTNDKDRDLAHEQVELLKEYRMLADFKVEDILIQGDLFT